jgi:CRP/FNR family transcriptional regulator, cyclic AMP receptor protein
MSDPSAAFGNLIRDQLLSMQGVTRIMQARRNTVLYMTSNPADSVFFLDAGLVKLVKRDDQNKEVLLRLVQPEEIFGEDAMLIGGLRQSIAEVLLQSTIYIIPRELFSRFCNERQENWRLLAEMLVHRQQALEQKIELLIMRDVEPRILLTLADLAEVLGSPDEQTGGSDRSIPLSHGEIAGVIGATRETTSSTLNALARRGLIKLGRRKVTVADPNVLREAAEFRALKN